MRFRYASRVDETAFEAYFEGPSLEDRKAMQHVICKDMKAFNTNKHFFTFAMLALHNVIINEINKGNETLPGNNVNVILLCLWKQI